MKNQYLCPHCRSELNIKDYIILSTKTERGLRGVMLISPVLGNYTIIHDDKFDYIEGEQVDFFCPVCHKDLTIPEIHNELARVLMIDENNVEFDIVFSAIAGKKCTFKIKGKSIIESYGKDAEDYINYWGEEPEY